MRLLCLDVGDKRTGLASGDTETGIASPLKAIEIPLARGEALADAVVIAGRDQGAEGFVLGLPLNMDGTEGPQAAKVRTFGALLDETTRLPIAYHDERLSSERADEAMARSGLTHKQKKARRDALAAAAILQDYLDCLEAGQGE